MATLVMDKTYTIEILDKSLSVVGIIRNPYPLNVKGDIIRFNNELSYYGQCTFRVGTEDANLSQYGDIYVPHKYHVRVRRKGKIVWQGAITDNSSRNKRFIEIIAHEYLFYFDKKLVKRDTAKQSGFVGDDWKNYRYFSTGTMAAAVTSIMNSAISSFSTNHALSSISLGTIENPNYGKGFTKPNGTALTGAWTFSVANNIIMSFDYQTVLHVLRSFGDASTCDFILDNDLEFSFKKMVGSKRLEQRFIYGTHGNILNYDVPRYGRRMVNQYTGIAIDDKNQTLHVEQKDNDSISEYGTMESSTAFTDVINKNMLSSRLAEDLRFLAVPETAPINITIDDKTYPIGTWGVGDIVNVKIKDGLIDYEGPRRIVGITTFVHNTGKEIITVRTNKPREDLL